MKKPVPYALPSLAYRQAIYQVYLSIYERRQALEPIRVQLLTNLLGGRPWAWRVVGISEGAIKHFVKNDYRSSKGLQRDHFIQRRHDTYSTMLSKNDTPMEFEAWWQYFWHNDRTVMMTKAEHNSKNKNELFCYPIDWRERYFPTNTIGYKFRITIEGAWLKEMIPTSELLPISTIAALPTGFNENA